MASDEHGEDLLGLVADERLLSEDADKLPAGLGRPQPIPERQVRGRLVGLGATLTGVTLVGGIALAIFAAIELLFESAGLLAVVALIVGLALVATHWGWVHVAEISADGIERRSNAGIIADRQAWLAAIAPFARYEITTSAGDDGSITIERIRHRPLRSGEGTFTFAREIELTEPHSGAEPAAVVAERAELLRRDAAVDTERERARFEAAADEFNQAALAAGDDRERARARAQESRALSEQINANLRDPPLIE